MEGVLIFGVRLQNEYKPRTGGGQEQNQPIAARNEWSEEGEQVS
jgi:hypothetical protein